MCPSSSQTSSASWGCAPSEALYWGTLAIFASILLLVVVNASAVIPSLLSAKGSVDLPHCFCRDRNGGATPCWFLSAIATAGAVTLLGLAEIGAKLYNPEQYWPGVRGRGFWAISTPGFYFIAIATGTAIFSVLQLICWSSCADKPATVPLRHETPETNESSTLLTMTAHAPQRARA